MKKRIIILGTGGTISGRANLVSDNLGYVVGEVDVEEVLNLLPKERHFGFDIGVQQLAQVDSKDMSFALLAKLAERVASLLVAKEVAGIVITHGTDTLEETAFFLHRVCKPSKPVVLTCAMRPATSLLSDGPQNLSDALVVASEATIAGVFIVCAGRIHDAYSVQKIHPYRLDAFSSGEARCCGFVEEGRIRFVAGSHSTQTKSFDNTGTDRHVKFPLLETDWPWVEIVLSFAGANGLAVKAMAAQGIRGIVVAATGNGTIHKDLERALLDAQASGVAIEVATRCSEGQVLSLVGGKFNGSLGFSPVKTRIALILKLMNL